MAMVGTALGALIKTEIEAIPGLTVQDSAELTNFCNALGTAIVDYIVENAVVLPGSFSNAGGAVGGTGELS